MVVASHVGRRISWTKPVVALLLALAMVSMCAIVATTMSMPMTGSGAAATAADHLTDEQVCGMGASTECTTVAVTVGLALLGLLFMLLRQRSYLVVVMRSLITARRKTWRPPRLHLTPIRFQLCVMRT